MRPVEMGPEDAGAEFFDLWTAETTDDLERRGREAAHAIAAADPNAGVRAWAPSLLEPARPPKVKESATVPPPNETPPAPPTLF